jgi:hypothetical protein
LEDERGHDRLLLLLREVRPKLPERTFSPKKSEKVQKSSKKSEKSPKMFQFK